MKMKKLTSLVLASGIMVMPVLTTNCFASSKAAIVNQTAQGAPQAQPKKAAQINQVVIQPSGQQPGNSQNAAQANGTQPANQNSSGWFGKIVKGGLTIGATVVALLFAQRCGLSKSLGTATRWCCDTIANAGRTLYDFTKQFCLGFSEASEIKVHDDAICPGITADWFTSKDTKCINELKKQLEAVYKNNTSLFNDPRSQYALVFKKVK